MAKAEQQGVKIDGFDARVAIDADTDLTAMFKTLAATGKQIRLTILSVMGDTESEAAQSLGRAVTNYKQQVPQAQRYGISFAAVGESGTNAGLWTSGYNRKQTYASLVEALK